MSRWSGTNFEINFWDKNSQMVYNNDVEKVYKSTARMFREITHEKPPRGRPGRQLPQDENFCVKVTTTGRHIEIAQGPLEAQDELVFLEKHTHYTNDTDLARLAKAHQDYLAQLKIKGVAAQLSDLMSGLMGLGIENLRIVNENETMTWREPRYVATFVFDNFTVQIREKT